jgi:hypothetical protein
MMPPRKSPLLGRRRITQMELWDTDFVVILEPAYITFEAKGGGEFVFGAVRGDLDCRYGPDGVRFTWEGFDEMDPALGAGCAKLAPDASLTGEIRFHRGDESTFKARRG